MHLQPCVGCNLPAAPFLSHFPVPALYPTMCPLPVSHHVAARTCTGEFFLAKEGKVCSDLLPGGAPVELATPKLAPSAPPKARSVGKLAEVHHAAVSRAQSSDY